MDSIIKDKLQEIEKNHAVKILYACEWGSRAVAHQNQINVLFNDRRLKL
jgi:hypothetical protein